MTAVLLGLLPVHSGNSGSLPLEIDLRQNLADAERLMIAGGVVGRGYVVKNSLEAQADTDDSTKAVADNRPPLVEAFETAHFEATLGLLDGVATALRTPPDPLPPGWVPPVLSGNLAGGLHYGRWPEAAARFDFLNNELNVAALNEDLAHFLGAAALVEASGAAFLVMPSAAANRVWTRSENPVAYARGTGLTYALGGHMHVPWCLYDGTQFARYYGTPALHQPIFRMIHENRGSFDGYVPALWHVMEIPYGDRGIEDIKSLEADLRSAFDAGIPLTLRFRAQDSLFGPDRFRGKPVSSHVWGQSPMPARGTGPLRMLRGFDGAYLPPIPRVSAEASPFPLVLHLVRGFDEKSKQSAQFEISKKWLPAASIKTISVASVEWPGQAAAKIRWEATPEGNTLVEIENVPAWAVIKVETKAPIQLPGVERGAFRERMPESEIPLMRMIRFGDKWKRPAWVDQALASETDPLDGYHITRITWSYEAGGAEIEHARKRGWGFHGSIGLLHSHMGAPAGLGVGDLITRPPGWKGWACYPDGRAMLIRPDWNPPRYGASFASPEYREAVLERARMWMALGVTGIQFDDVMGMLNRVWQYGGDFSDAMMKEFRSRLIAAGFPDVTEATPLEDLRDRVVAAIQWENAARVVNAAPPGTPAAGWISAPFQATSAAYPGEILISPEPFQKPGSSFVVEYEVRFTGGRGPWANLILADGDRSFYLSRYIITPETHKEVLPIGQWLRIRLRYDPAARTMSYAVGMDASWSEPEPFEPPPAAGDPSAYAAILMANPLVGGLDVRSVTIRNESAGIASKNRALPGQR